jgi:glycosyltransferase involved in cell wall biosynthesis
MPRQSRPRILQIISTLEGGGGRNALELVRGFQGDKRFDVRLCVLGTPPLDETPSPDDPIDFLHAPVHQRSTLYHRMMGLSRLIARWQPQLIHSQLWPTALTAGLVVPRSLPHLIHIYDTPSSLQSPRWGASLRRAVLRRIVSSPRVRLVAVSTAAAEYSADALRMNRSRIQTVMNGVSLDEFLAVPELRHDPESPFVIACAGRLIAEKGFHHVLEAVRCMTLPRDKFRVCLAGTGSAESSLRELCQRCGIAEIVHFAGSVTDMPAFFSKADLFVHGSVAEGLARVLMESLASGRPVVASEHAGVREAIDDGVTGIVVPASEPQLLAQAIESLLTNPSRRLKMGAAARRCAVEQFSVQRVIAEVSGVYSEMLCGLSND